MTKTPETLNILNPDFRMPEHCGGDRWSILHGDSLQILRQFEPNSFDAIITDPPYASGGSSQTTKNRSTNEKYSSMSKEKALPDFDSDQMDQLSWMFWTAAWLQDARRIAKPGAPVCLFIDWRQLPAMTLALQWAGWTWRGVAVWDKVASRPQKGRFRQQSEYIVWGSNGKMPLERNVGCLPGVFRYPNPQNRMHDFARAAKAHGLLFCPIRDKMDPDHIEIAILQDDASKANRIIEKLQLDVVDTGTAELVDAVQQNLENAAPNHEDPPTVDFPLGSENASPSEPFSDSSKSFANSPSPRADLLRAKGERPSVRMELQDITAHLRNRAEAPKDRMPKLPVKIRRKEKVM